MFLKIKNVPNVWWSSNKPLNLEGTSTPGGSFENRPINNLIFLVFAIDFDVNSKIFYLLFIYLITIKGEI